MRNWISYIILCKRDVELDEGYDLHWVGDILITLNNLILVVTQ